MRQWGWLLCLEERQNTGHCRAEYPSHEGEQEDSRQDAPGARREGEGDPIGKGKEAQLAGDRIAFTVSLRSPPESWSKTMLPKPDSAS